jgi:hypothetical protein
VVIAIPLVVPMMEGFITPVKVRVILEVVAVKADGKAP